MLDHDLHKIIGKIIYDNLSDRFNIYLDPACWSEGTTEKRCNIPLFMHDVKKGNDTEISNVDILVTNMNNEVILICEIEESNVKPTQIFGKYLTVALSKGWALKAHNEVRPFSKGFKFLQILSGKKLNDGSKKERQWENIEDSILTYRSSHSSNITSYKIIHGKHKDFDVNETKHLDLINFLKTL